MPPPALAFADMGLPGVLLRNLAALGITKPTPVQSQAVPALAAVPPSSLQSAGEGRSGLGCRAGR